MDDLKTKMIAAIKTATGATAVRNFPTGEGEGFATTMDGHGLRFVDEAGTHRYVATKDLVLPPAPPAPSA